MITGAPRLARPDEMEGIINETTDEQTDGPQCANCYAPYGTDDIGTTCRDCGRGIVK